MKLAFGIHNHQPVGNFDNVFRESAEKCYMPFLEAMSKSSFRFSLHTSGPLIEWLDDGMPRYHEMVAGMVAEGRVEAVAGGFYEPILPIWPREQAVAQVSLMRSELKRRYDADARGLWLAERVWDPSLPEVLRDAGIDYTVLDDSHFRYAGLTLDPILGHYLTERAGATVSVLPISKQLRYMIPFSEPGAILDYLWKIHERHPDAVITYMDDGEKFGVWPGTNKWVYRDGWLRRFIEALDHSREWLEVIPLGEALGSEPEGRIYLPCASYEEMMEWALPADAIRRYEDLLGKVEAQGLREEARPFLRGGFWDNFLVKYPETNLIHKRLMAVANEIRERVGPPNHSGDLHEAWRKILRAQCNCAYWHGLFGGVYLNYLRHALWENLLAAESIVLGDGNGGVDVRRTDVDLNGRDEIIVYDGVSRWGFKRSGGACFLVESMEGRFAFHNIMTRRPEAYHYLRQKPGGVSDHGAGDAPATIHDIQGEIDEKIVYDIAPRFSFVDHFFPNDSSPGRFMDSTWREMGDFFGNDWEMDFASGDGSARVTATRKGEVAGAPVRGEKEFEFMSGSGTLTATIRFEPTKPWPPGRYGVAFNFTLLAPDAPDRYYLVDGIRPTDSHMASMGVSEGAERFAALDDYLGVGLEWELDPPMDIWRAPIMTVSRSESGFEKSFQGSWVMFNIPLPEGSAPLELKIVWKMKSEIKRNMEESTTKK